MLLRRREPLLELLRRLVEHGLVLQLLDRRGTGQRGQPGLVIVADDAVHFRRADQPLNMAHKLLRDVVEPVKLQRADLAVSEGHACDELVGQRAVANDRVDIRAVALKAVRRDRQKVQDARAVAADKHGHLLLGRTGRNRLAVLVDLGAPHGLRAHGAGRGLRLGGERGRGLAVVAEAVGRGGFVGVVAPFEEHARDMLVGVHNDDIERQRGLDVTAGFAARAAHGETSILDGDVRRLRGRQPACEPIGKRRVRGGQIVGALGERH